MSDLLHPQLSYLSRGQRTSPLQAIHPPTSTAMQPLLGLKTLRPFPQVWGGWKTQAVGVLGQGEGCGPERGWPHSKDHLSPLPQLLASLGVHGCNGEGREVSMGCASPGEAPASHLSDRSPSTSPPISMPAMKIDWAISFSLLELHTRSHCAGERESHPATRLSPAQPLSCAQPAPPCVRSLPQRRCLASLSLAPAPGAASPFRLALWFCNDNIPSAHVACHMVCEVCSAVTVRSVFKLLQAHLRPAVTCVSAPQLHLCKAGPSACPSLLQGPLPLPPPSIPHLPSVS